MRSWLEWTWWCAWRQGHGVCFLVKHLLPLTHGKTWSGRTHQRWLPAVCLPSGFSNWLLRLRVTTSIYRDVGPTCVCVCSTQTCLVLKLSRLEWPLISDASVVYQARKLVSSVGFRMNKWESLFPICCRLFLIVCGFEFLELRQECNSKYLINVWTDFWSNPELPRPALNDKVGMKFFWLIK